MTVLCRECIGLLVSIDTEVCAKTMGGSDIRRYSVQVETLRGDIIEMHNVDEREIQFMAGDQREQVDRIRKTDFGQKDERFYEEMKGKYAKRK